MENLVETLQNMETAVAGDLKWVIAAIVVLFLVGAFLLKVLEVEER